MALKEIENQIRAITGSKIESLDIWHEDPNIYQEVKSLLRERQRILNDMFVADEKAMLRFREINERLFTLTRQLFERVNKFHDDLSSLMTQKDFDDDYNLEGTLRFCFNDEESVLRLEDDERYGSDFMLMIKLISDVTYGRYEENIEDIHYGSQPLDDGQSWNEYPFRGRKEFEDIIICHAVHQLTDHQLYSIPDLLRLNDFWAEVNLTIQSITDQKGNHWKPEN